MEHAHSGDPLDVIGKFAETVFIKARPLQFGKFATVGHRLAEADERIQAGEGDLRWSDFMAKFCPSIPLGRADQLIASHLNRSEGEVRRTRAASEEGRTGSTHQPSQQLQVRSGPLDALAMAAHDDIREAERHQAEAQQRLDAADQRYSAAGLKLKEARDRLRSGEMDMTWAEFLQMFCPISKSRSYELIAIAEGRTTAEELREKARARKQAHRERQRQRDKGVRSGNGRSQKSAERKALESRIRQLVQDIRQLDDLDAIRQVEDVVAGIRSGASCQPAA